MFQHQGIWLPDGEKHFPEWMDRNGELVDGRGTYQIRKFREAMKWVREFRTAIDVGAHVGLWSMQLTKKFEFVEAFEPVEWFRQCYLANMPETGWGLHHCALGAAPGRAGIFIPAMGGGIDSGGTHLTDGEAVEVRTLDSFAFDKVDFVKIDCEGYEHQVLLGALATLERCKPCVIVEQKPHKLGPNFGINGTPAVDLLTGLGAKVRAVLSGDYILSW